MKKVSHNLGMGLDLFRKLVLVFCAIITLSFSAYSQDLNEDQEISDNGTIIIETETDITKSYKERRGRHGALFSVFTEAFNPLSYVSGFENGGTIGDIIANSEIQLMGVELGYKYNVGPGSIAAVFSYSQGGATGQTVSGTVANPSALSFIKKSIGLNAAADAITAEPWVVPYGQVSLNFFESHEEQVISSQSQSADAASGMMIGYKLGALFQIDWIESLFDASAKEERLRSSSLENTFIDVYYATYLADSAAAETAESGQIPPINLESDGQIGVGLKLEF